MNNISIDNMLWEVISIGGKKLRGYDKIFIDRVSDENFDGELSRADRLKIMYLYKTFINKNFNNFSVVASRGVKYYEV